MASFTQCPILFTLMLLPAITHAAVVEVDSKGGAVLEAADKLMRQKGENTPDLTKVERYPDSAEPTFESTVEITSEPMAEPTSEGEDGPPLQRHHLFSGTECANCDPADGDCATITRSQCILLDEVFGMVDAKNKYEEPINDILKKLWEVRFQCTGNAEKAAFRAVPTLGCIIDCGPQSSIDWNRYQLGEDYNDAFRDANDDEAWAKRIRALEEAGKGMVCKKRAPLAPPLQAENPFKDMAKPFSCAGPTCGISTPAKRAKQKDLDNFLADPYCDDYSIKQVKGKWFKGDADQKVWEKLTDKDVMPTDEKKGWAVRDVIEYLRTQTGTTASTCNGITTKPYDEGEPSWSPSM